MIKSTFEVVGSNTGKVAKVVTGIFPGGEVRVRMPNVEDLTGDTVIRVTVKLKCAAGIQVLAQIQDILRHYLINKPQIILLMQYAPYARQDRVCSPGEALAARTFANQINAMEFHNVLISDSHSDVMSSLINNVANFTKGELFKSLKVNFYADYDVFIAPDYGASKEVEALAIKYKKHFVQGTKKRDPDTGNLSGFGCNAPAGDLNGRRVLIIDDMCDGGGTFLGLAEALEKDNSRIEKLSLYVTHGLFTNGVLALEKIFDSIYTTDSYASLEDYPMSECITQRGVQLVWAVGS